VRIEGSRRQAQRAHDRSPHPGEATPSGCAGSCSVAGAVVEVI